MMRIENVSRRSVLRAGASAGVFVLAAALPACGRKEASFVDAAPTAAAPAEPLNIFVGIGEDGGVTITCHRAEMGQHAKTGLARVIADELEADWSRVSVVLSEGDAKYGDQNTDGSTTIRNDFLRLRRIGASARSMLERAAAEQWGAPAGECKAVLHEVVHEPTGRRAAYGDLAAAAAKLEPPAFEGEAVGDGSAYRLKSPAEWRYIGKSATSVDANDIVKGAAAYGQDVRAPGMKYAVIARPPALGGAATSYDADAALAVAGVLQVIEVPIGDRRGGFNPLGGVAVIAQNTWAAISGRNALNVQWSDGPNADYDSVTYRAALEETVRAPQRLVRNKGDADAAFAAAARIVSAEYYVPHLSHAQMEPPAALADYKDGKVEVWTSTQNPQQARLDLADILGLDYANVRVNNLLLGGGFGRKSKPDFVYEAALLSREIGAPVKVVWTREDDIRHDYLHTVSAQRIEAAIDASGAVTGWRHRVAFPSIVSTFNPSVEDGSDGELSLGFLDNPFNIANLRLENGKAKGKTRIGWLRSVNNIQHAFAVQSFVAELAAALNRDPKDLLLELIGPDRQIDLANEGLTAEYANYNASIADHPIDTGRLKNVLRIAADRIGWRSDLPAGRGMGIAAHRSFVSYIATAVEVSVGADGALEIPKIWVACDCGVAVNPDSVRAQMEGGTLYALSNTLESAITFTGGRINQSNFHDYRVLRMPRIPKELHVEIVDSDTAPGGVGEPATPTLAPALANAIFAATGKRIRELPLAAQLSA